MQQREGQFRRVFIDIRLFLFTCAGKPVSRN